MNPPRSHEEVEALLGAYALDALDPDEAVEVERHLATCPRCRAEVADHQETASWLAITGSPAPAELWDRIAAELSPPLPDALADPPPVSLVDVRAGRDGRAAGTGGRAAAQDRRRRTTIGGALVAAAAAVVIGVLGVRVADQGDQIDRLEDAMGASPTDVMRRSAEVALADASNRSVRLVSADRSMAVHAVVTPDGHGFVVGDEVPVLPSGKTYQLWGIDGERVISLGVLGPSIDVAAFVADAGVDALAVTEEDAPGVAVSQQQPTAAGELV